MNRTEIQLNSTLAIRAERALTAVRDLAALLAEDSPEAAHLGERLTVRQVLGEYDHYLVVSTLAQAVLEQDRRISELERKIES